MRGRGFTIIELLVTVSIIAVLAALVMPVVIQVKNKAFSYSAANSLRQIGMACALYRDDHSGYFPYPHWASKGDASDLNGDGVAEWYEVLSIYFTDGRILRVHADFSDPDVRPCSFADNSWFDYVISESYVLDPSDTVYATEREDDYEYDFIEWWLWQDKWPPDSYDIPYEAAAEVVDIERYNGFNNYLYVDGHVRARKFQHTWFPRVTWWPEAPADAPAGGRF
ncbi:MAG: type II secretion system protein [Armatimonadetes bacterium]|nr:type II secretion system protein [Armatimonadota bacterium]